MSKFLTQIQLKAGITTTFESATPEEVLDTLVALTSPGEAARAAVPAQAVPAADPAPAAPPAVISRGNLSMEISDPYEGRSPAPALTSPVAVEVVEKKKRTDQKKGAAKVAAVLEQKSETLAPIAVETPVPSLAPAETPTVAAPKPVSSAGKGDTYEKLVTAVRNFARNKGIPAATKLVAEFKTAKGEAAARLDQVQAEDYAAMLARIDTLSL